VCSVGGVQRRKTPKEWAHLRAQALRARHSVLLAVRCSAVQRTISPVPGLKTITYYVAACCSVLLYVAVCCSVLQCVAVCCSVSQCVAVYCSTPSRQC